MLKKKNYVDLFTILLGALIGHLLSIGFLFYMKFQLGDLLATIEIIVNVVFGALIVLVIQKRMSDDRGVKNYFISETNELLSAYNIFFNEVYNKKRSCKNITSWFKIMTSRLEQLRLCLNEDLQIPEKELNNIINHRNLQMVLTGSEDFNNQFSRDFYEVSDLLKSQIEEAYGKLRYSLLKTIISINRA